MRDKAEILNMRKKGNVIIGVFFRDNDQVKLKCVSILCKLTAHYHLGNSETVRPLSTESTIATLCITEDGLPDLLNSSIYSP
jgi:hypothetical protein